MSELIAQVEKRREENLKRARAEYRAIMQRDVEGVSTDSDAVILAEVLETLGVTAQQFSQDSTLLRAYFQSKQRVEAFDRAAVDAAIKLASEKLSAAKEARDAAMVAFDKAIQAMGDAEAPRHAHQRSQENMVRARESCDAKRLLD